MHITCKECNSDFELRVESVDPNRGVKSACPFCRAKFKVHPQDENGHRNVTFEEKGPKLRTCLECGREFLGDPTAPIPICEDCQGPAPGLSNAETTPLPRRTEKSGEFSLGEAKIWKVLIRGKMTEHTSEKSIREWIVQGLIDETHKVVLPSGEEKSAFQIPSLKEAFRMRDQKRTSSQLQQVRWLPSIQIKPLTILGWFLVVLFCFLLAFTGYRAFTYSPPQHLTNTKLRMILTDVRASTRPLQLSEAAAIQRAQRLMASDRQRDYDNSLTLLRSALLQHQASSEVLGLLAESYSYFARNHPEPKALVSSLQLANLCTDLYPKEVFCLIAKTRAALAAENFEVAKEASENALELNPSEVRALLARSAFLIATKNRDYDEEAREYLERIIKVEPGMLEAYDLLGMLEIQEGNPVAARSAFERRMTIAPDDPLALHRMSILSEKAARYQEAIEWNQSALRLEREYVEPRFRLAEIEWYGKKDFRDAEKHFSLIVNRYPMYADTNILQMAKAELVALYLRRNALAEAEEVARDLTASFAENPVPPLVRAQFDLMENKPQKAAGLLRTAIDRQPDPVLFLALARVIESTSRKDQTDQVVKAYREAIDADPYWSLPYFYALTFLIGQERWEEAMDIANTGLSRHLNSNQDLLHPELKDRLIEPKWEVYRRALVTLINKRKSATSFATLAWIHMTHAHWTRDSRFYTEAIANLRAALSITPNHEASLLMLAKSLYHRGKYSEARRILQKALNVNPVGTSLKYWLGRIHLAKQEWNAAENTLKEVEKDNVWGAFATYELGVSAQKKGNTDLALRRFREALRKAPRLSEAWASLLDFGTL